MFPFLNITDGCTTFLTFVICSIIDCLVRKIFIWDIEKIASDSFSWFVFCLTASS